MAENSSRRRKTQWQWQPIRARVTKTGEWGGIFICLQMSSALCHSLETTREADHEKKEERNAAYERMNLTRVLDTCSSGRGTPMCVFPTREWTVITHCVFVHPGPGWCVQGLTGLSPAPSLMHMNESLLSAVRWDENAERRLHQRLKHTRI